ncbi:uncharacterized protein LOC118274105 isoform X1 [Spodoptera frugiperda]|uniref:Uncharacterized protein LOC118274105 isoform X1 n=1 Tax=Spodoptera frugiperda TaxID=7108 RepID=A0A9R0F6M9_SPOFR|nr:uncharacterized protein LOC118274105 isoform X1 [Spodoptera frugiperda]
MSQNKVIFKRCIVIFSLFITASSPQLMRQNDLDLYSNAKWVWDYGDVNNSIQYTEYPTIPPKTDVDLPEICLPYDPPMPNFNAPGKRISEAKCDEYIWLLKKRHESTERHKKCEEELDRIAPNRTQSAALIGGIDAGLGEYPHMVKSSLQLYIFLIFL